MSEGCLSNSRPRPAGEHDVVEEGAQPEDLLRFLGPHGLVTYGRRLSDLAASHPDRTAMIFAPEAGEERHVSWAELDRQSNRVAHALAELGVSQGSTVVVGLPNRPEHQFCCYGAWKLGACVLPMRWDLPVWERDRLLEIANPTAVVSEWPDAGPRVVLPQSLLDGPDAPLDDRVAFPAVAIGTGGSTGRPKIVRTPFPGAAVPGSALGHARQVLGWDAGHVHLIAGPLYHMSPFWMTTLGLFEDQTIVLMDRFDAARVVDLIERHRVNCGTLVPTMLFRILRLPGVNERDFSSVVSILTGGAKCPAWVMRAWIDILGPERVWESYGAAESHGNAYIRGDEWLQHPGSVGRPYETILRICDAEGRELPNGEVGEVFMRRANLPKASFEYVGSPGGKVTEEGLMSVGDLGWVDEDGYLYIADRRDDMIITGGANVYPAEIEAALSEHPDVVDVAVVGLKDDHWGHRVHALIQPADPTSPPPIVDLDGHCRARLARYKIPKSYEFVRTLPRNEAGKIRRSALATVRDENGADALLDPQDGSEESRG